MRKRKEIFKEKLVESELKYKTLIEDILDIFFTADKELNVTTINPAGQRVFGCSKDVINNVNLYELIYEADSKRFVDFFKNLFLSKKEYIECFEFRIKTVEGHIKHLELNARVNYGENDEIVQIEGVLRDITERIKLENKLSQIDKLNALGLQSSGVAHELNNILGIILGYLDILKLKLESTNAHVSDTINIIEKAARDGATIVDKIQQFSRTKPNYSGVLHANLAEVVNEAIEFTMPRWKREAQAKGIEYKIIKNFLIPSKHYIRSNPSELREVFVNIINNSVDAMPNGGKIKFSAKFDAKSVILSIADNGIGIRDEIKDKIFEPFFSTKGIKRTGLGMSIVDKIVTRYGGEISIDSCYGKGTTVHIEMPLFQAEIAECENKGKLISNYKAKILVIEEEEVILDMMKIMLEKHGHSVFTANDANTGLRMYKNKIFDIVLCDLAMPKVNGWKVARYIKDLDAIRKTAKTPFVLITGCELVKDKFDYVKEGVDFILDKPLDFKQLNKMISNLLCKDCQ
ncbi:MAG: ATP-binding protein [Candidatus Scalinduaceae bacterium]